MTIVDQPGDDINVSPIAFDDAYNVVGNTTFVVNAANGILNGATATHVTLSADAEFFTNTIGANAATQTHIVTTGVIDTAGGSVTLNADGSFTYTPDVGFTGTDSFTYTLTDAGLDGNFATAGDNLTGTGTVTLNVEDTVWFIDNTAPGSLNLGTQDNPFTSIAAFNAVNDGVGNHPAAGDIVYLRAGTYTEADGINLLNNQTLVGQGENLVVNHSLGGNITLETGSVGQTPVIVVTGASNQGIQLAQGNTISGLDVGMNNATAVGIADGGGTVGNLTISNVGVGVGSNLGRRSTSTRAARSTSSWSSVTSTGAARGIRPWHHDRPCGYRQQLHGLGPHHHQRRHRSAHGRVRLVDHRHGQAQRPDRRRHRPSPIRRPSPSTAARSATPTIPAAAESTFRAAQATSPLRLRSPTPPQQAPSSRSPGAPAAPSRCPATSPRTPASPTASTSTATPAAPSISPARPRR